MPLAEGAALLRGRYELGARRSAAGEVEAWTAYDDDGVQYLARTWAYDGDEPDPVQRALWDAELRTLYRVGSSPGADDTLAVLKDAGLDRDAKSFVMVLQAPGYDSVADALAARAEHGWLSSHNPADRRKLWQAAGRVAAGLAVLHSQDVLHRDVGAAALLYLPDEPAESIRLGGFEWSVRLGRPLDADPPVSWSSPPERLGGDTAAWRPDDDWFGFGMLCARLVRPPGHRGDGASLRPGRPAVRSSELPQGRADRRLGHRPQDRYEGRAQFCGRGAGPEAPAPRSR